MKYYAVIDTNVIVSAYLHWDSVPGNLMDVYIEASNPFEAYNALDDIFEGHEKYCIDVVPLGTKPMAL